MVQPRGPRSQRLTSSGFGQGVEDQVGRGCEIAGRDDLFLGDWETDPGMGAQNGFPSVAATAERHPLFERIAVAIRIGRMKTTKHRLRGGGRRRC